MWHFQPVDGYFGDPIPFFWQGTYHVFFLQAPLEPRRSMADHTFYAHISSRDLIHWRQHPVAIRPTAGQPDSVSCWTGSIFEHEGTFYLFYTGHDPENAERPQSVCLATSTNLDDWTRHVGGPLSLPPAPFRKTDWRDPFLLRSEEDGSFLMSLTTMREDLPVYNSGALVMLRSRDLLHWDAPQTYYQPGNGWAPECSDLFRLGEFWYVVISLFHRTCYRMAPALEGPWRTGRTLGFDSAMFYAAKTIYDGENRYLVGWIRTKRGRTDDGAWEWGGVMGLPRKIVQDEEGNLYSCFPESVARLRGALHVDLAQAGAADGVLFGQWQGSLAGWRGSAPLYNELQTSCPAGGFDAELSFTIEEAQGNAGFAFYRGRSTHPGYEVCVDLRRQMLIFRLHNERFLQLAAQEVILEPGRPIEMRIIVEGDLIEICVDNRFSLSSCFYAQEPPATCGFFCEDGPATLHGLRVHTLAPAPALEAAGSEVRELDAAAETR